MPMPGLRSSKGSSADHQRLDVLVNNAGFHRDNLLANMPPEDWDAVLRANLDAVFHGCRAVVRHMMGQRFGRIINIASLSALLAPAGQTNYAAAKAGVVALTQSLAKEVARAAITVNALCPGYIETEALSEMDGDQKKSSCPWHSHAPFRANPKKSPPLCASSPAKRPPTSPVPPSRSTAAFSKSGTGILPVILDESIPNPIGRTPMPRSAREKKRAKLRIRGLLSRFSIFTNLSFPCPIHPISRPASRKP